MEFNFQKPKPPAPLDFQLMHSRNRNQNEGSGILPNLDFNFQRAQNEQSQSNSFTLPDFESANNSSQFQFMFGAPSPSDDNFHQTRRKNDGEKSSDFFQRRPPSRMNGFLGPTPPPDEPQSRISSLRVDLTGSPKTVQNPFPSEEKSIEDKSNREHEKIQSNSKKQSMAPENTQSQIVNESGGKSMKNSNTSSAEISNHPLLNIDKNEMTDKIYSELNEFSKHFTKISTEKAELILQKERLETSLKENQKQSLHFQNLYDEMKEKLEEELKNRESIESQIIYINSVSEVVQKHCKDITNTLQLYKDINREHTERHNKNMERLVKLEQVYENTLQEKKTSIAVLKNKVLDLERKLETKGDDLKKTIEAMNLQSKEAQAQLSMEQERYNLLQKDLSSSQAFNEELLSQIEDLKKTSSEKYAALQNVHSELESKYQDLENQNNDLLIYKSKCTELDNCIEKVQEEKKELSMLLESSQQNLLKSENDCTKLSDLKKELDLQLERTSDQILKLQDESAELNLNLKEEKESCERLRKEIEESQLHIVTKGEEIEVMKGKYIQIENKLKEAVEQIEDKEIIILEMKKQICDLVDELSEIKLELVAKDEEKSKLEKNIAQIVTQKEQLDVNAKQLEIQIQEKEELIISKENEIVNLKSEVEKAIEAKNNSNIELQNSLHEVEKLRQEMMFNVEQYREQYMSELKENEDKRKELQQKCESSSMEIEKITQEKKKLENKFQDLQTSLKQCKENMSIMNETIQKLKKELEKEKSTSNKKTNEQDSKFTEFKEKISQLEEENASLNQNVQDLNEKLKGLSSVQDEKEALEKQVEVLEMEVKELKQKTKPSSSTKVPDVPSANKLKQVFPEEMPVPKKRICFDDDFNSDASSIDLQNFLTHSFGPKSVPSTSKKSDPKPRRSQKNARSGNQNKKFFRFNENDDFM